MQFSGYSAYKVAATTTTKSKKDLLLMLFEGLLTCLRLAKKGMLKKQWGLKGEQISKAVAILGELDCALDHEQGGSMATNLSGLYRYATIRLTEANLRKDITALTEVEQLLSELQSAFIEAAAATPADIPEPMVAVTAGAEGVNIAI